MLRFVLIPVVAFAFAAACGGDDDAPSGTEPPSATTAATLSPLDAQAIVYARLMTLAEARAFASDLGTAGEVLTAEHYQCVYDDCSSSPSTDDDLGCLVVIPTGDPALANNAPPSDPPGWYSIGWRGAKGETYSARPEKVTGEPRVSFEPGIGTLCGASVSRSFAAEMTAEQADQLIEAAGLSGSWDRESEAVCVTDIDCPIPGSTVDTVGCVVATGVWPPNVSPADGAEFAVTWFPTGAPPQNMTGHTSDLARAEAYLTIPSDRPCYGPLGEPRAPYIPYTDLIVPTEWRLTEEPSGTTLQLLVAVGNSCSTFERLDVSETADAVDIEAYSRDHNPGPNEGCDDILLSEERTVELAEPLGERALEGCDPPPDVYYFDDSGCAVVLGG